MKRDTEETIVVFRVWRSAPYDVIALMPEQEYQRGDGSRLVTSYQHIGQHSDADYDHVIRATRPATLEEYGDLFRELEGIGYRVKVRQRYTRRG